MPITDLTSDAAKLTLTVVGEYPVPVERLWQAWSDPRQIEQFWGPPEWPATFTRHDMAEGGRSEYFMVGPDGEKAAGYWIFQSVDEGRRFTIIDGFMADDGSANEDMPKTETEFRFEKTETGSRFTGTTIFESLEGMQQLVDMGMLEGMESALSQMDDVLSDLKSFAHGRETESKILTDTVVRFSRVVRGSVEQVWRAHHEPALLQQWLLGPDGWTMPVCTVAERVGDSYRYEWESADGEQRFGFEGVLLESAPPRRSVSTEAMIGMDGPSTNNEMTLTEVEGGTLLAIVVTYPSVELRDQIMATGMIDGMEASYARLEETLTHAAV